MDEMTISIVENSNITKKNMYDDFRNEIVKLVKQLNDNQTLMIKNVDAKHENVIRTLLKSTGYFAQSLGKVFTTSCKKDRIMYVSILGEQSTSDTLNYFTKIEENKLIKFRDEFYINNRIKIADAITDLIIDYSEIDK